MTTLFVWLLKGNPESLRPPLVRDRLKDYAGAPKIRCPRCEWEPQREDRWSCSCLFVWNTFDTGGVCPACQMRWLETMCLQCHDWSQHEDWYVHDGADKPSA